MERRTWSQALQAGTTMKFQNKLIFIYCGDIFGQHLPIPGVGKFVAGFLLVPIRAEALMETSGRILVIAWKSSKEEEEEIA